MAEHAGSRTIRRRRPGEAVPLSVVCLGLVSIFLLGLNALQAVLPQHASLGLLMFNLNASPQQPAHHRSAPAQVALPLVHLSQLDPGQYASSAEFQLWAYSACSTAAMTEVFDSYGRHYRISDVLQVEAKIGEITPQLGLVEEVGIERTAARFGFKTIWGHTLSLDQVIAIANAGKPVIVSFPPDRYAGGHLLVVIGGDSATVRLVASSLWKSTVLSRAQFLNWWGGFSAIVTPQ